MIEYLLENYPVSIAVSIAVGSVVAASLVGEWLYRRRHKGPAND
jgi:hypothetical protein